MGRPQQFALPATLAKEWETSQAKLKKLASETHVPTLPNGEVYLPAMRAVSQGKPQLSTERGIGAMIHALKNASIFGKSPAHVLLDDHKGNKRYYHLARWTSSSNYRGQYIKAHSRRYLTRRYLNQCDFELGTMVHEHLAHYYLFLCEENHYLWCIDHTTLCAEFAKVQKRTAAQNKEARKKGSMFRLIHRTVDGAGNKKVPHLHITLTIGGDYSVSRPSDIGL